MVQQASTNAIGIMISIETQTRWLMGKSLKKLGRFLSIFRASDVSATESDA